jgi:hypothetical protein
MPNHCTNTLIITGPDHDRLRFWQAIQDENEPNEKRLADLMPMPDGLTGPDGGWYSWALENWGTKWGDYDHYIAIFGTDYIELGYMTAWGPFEDNFWRHVSSLYPTLNFVVSYDEPGMAFCGASKYHNGETIASKYIDDYTQVIGEPDWDNQDNYSEWCDKLTDLRDSLLEQVDV